MRKTKEQKGITLIALIITIIVLLILAVVAIGAVQNDGIINYAKNARDQYSTAQTTENSTIQSYLDKIKEHVGTGSGVASGTGEKTEEDRITFYYDGIEYTAKRGDSWDDWDGFVEQKEIDGGLVSLYDFVCYEDGTWVKTDEEIRERIFLYKAV